jgi:arylsulfatase A
MIPRHLFPLLPCLFVASMSAVSPSRPNLVVILADDFGYECITANGGESYQTPNVDRLAAGGMRFERCHVQPLCTPTRVQLMTGLSNARNYIEFGAMDRRAVTFAQLLKSAGYVTGIAGKWQLGSEPDSPRHFGFDEALLWHHRSRESRYGNPGFDLNGEPKAYPPGTYGPTILNEFAIDFVSRHRERPFFLYYPMVLTHAPYQPTPDSPKWDPRTGERGNQSAANFPAMVAYLDRMVGEFMARLDSLGLRENTLVLFLGDNGTGIEITSRFKGEAYPGGKGRSHARGTHVPLIANWPGRVPAGTVNGDLVGSTDFLPTLLEAAAAKLPDGYPGDGVSFYPQLIGQKGRPRAALYAWYASDGGPVAKWEFAMSPRHKLYRDGRFFDLGSDPWEQTALKVENLGGESATAAKVLQAELDRYSDARPPELRQERVTAKQAKRAEKEKRKKQ